MYGVMLFQGPITLTSIGRKQILLERKCKKKDALVSPKG